MKTIYMKDASLAAYLAIVEGQPGDYRHLFRGQGNAVWPLIPSIYRTLPNVEAGSIEKNYDIYEWSGISRFFSEGLPYLPTLQRGPTNDRILAQHFRVPTRLLDWSFDPLVALWFAVEDRRMRADAAVFMILPDAWLDPHQITNGHAYKAIAVEPPAIDRRIPAQKSVFTWHPYGPANEPFVPIDQRPEMGGQITAGSGLVRGFAKIVIPFSVRDMVRHNLFAMGIDRRNLFPGLDGVGAHIADTVSWRD